MNTCVIAMDCWNNMPPEQIHTIGRLQADLRLSQHHDRPPHPLMPAWPQWQTSDLVQWIHRHRPVRVIYVGQHWQQCLHIRPTGIRRISQFRPWCQIQVRPSLCRVLEGPGDRVLRAADLGPEWHRVDRDLYQLTP